MKPRGSFALSRLANYHPGLLSKLAFIDIGYSPPGGGLSKPVITHINSMVKATMGYEVFGYFLFLTEDDAAALLDKNVSTHCPFERLILK